MTPAAPMGDEVTENLLLGGRVRLRQPRRGYRAAVDPVLLAAAVPAESGETALDVGLGTGAASLCLATRVPGVRIVGLEVQPELAELARANAALNGLDDRLVVVEGDIASAAPTLPTGGFDHVLTNPPYGAGGTPSGDRSRDIAHGAADLDRWLGFCLAMLVRRGWLTMIHRADHLDRIIAILHGRAGALRVIPLWPRSGQPARRVIIRARKGVRTPAVLCPGLILHDDGGYTAEAEAVLRHGHPIPSAGI